MPMREELRARVLLGIGVVGGIALTAVGLTGEGRVERGPGVLARVNGRPVHTETLARYVAGVVGERRAPSVDRAERRALLLRLVDEELLLQRGIELGLPRAEPTARRAIVAAVAAAATAGAEFEEPDPDSLRRFYEEDPQRFRGAARLRFESALVPVGSVSESKAYRRASELARRARAGESLSRLREEFAASNPMPAPDATFSLPELRMRWGVNAVEAAVSLATGEIGEPVRAADGWLVLRLLAQEPGPVRPYPEVASEVRFAYLRRARQGSLEKYLADLRAEAEIEIFESELDRP